MERYKNEVQFHEWVDSNANTDNQIKHSNCSDDNVKEHDSMKQVLKPVISFKSKSNPKVTITLEFGGKEESEKANIDLQDILKNLYMQKVKGL